jgi:hypothetical protein
MELLQRLYLDLMKQCLTDFINRYHEEIADLKARQEGRNWPKNAYTMIGLKRLDNIEFCIQEIIAHRIPGDLIETGVWRGGATIFMRAVLKALAVSDRAVWVADSFAGLPPPRPDQYPADRDSRLYTNRELVVSLDEVKRNFEQYGLLDGQVRFLPGWFRDSLPMAPIHSLALLRLDGDMYESTMDALTYLYPKISLGGYVIVDDYGGISACRQAVQEYRERHGITDPILSIDWTGVFWKRTQMESKL